MELFNSDFTEQIAIDYLKKHDDRYRNLVKTECPDFISVEDSIGVEVTLVEFNDFRNSFKYKGKKLIEYIRMKKIKPIQKKEFESINKVINSKYTNDVKKDLNEFIDSYYYKKGDKILKIKTIEEYNKLDPNTNLYSKLSFPKEMFIEGQKIIGFLPSSFFTGQIVDKYIESVKRKNQKFSNYRKFNENSLLIINYTAEKDESLEFEKRIKEIEGINFDKIFVLNAMFDKNIYEINLRK